MENLKNALGEELFGQVTAAIDAYNAADEHKDAPIKLADLSGGGYVSKDKHAALETEAAGYKQQLDTLTAQLQTIKDAKTPTPRPPWKPCSRNTMRTPRLCRSRLARRSLTACWVPPWPAAAPAASRR